jgi:hypothetical protein
MCNEDAPNALPLMASSNFKPTIVKIRNIS